MNAFLLIVDVGAGFLALCLLCLIFPRVVWIQPKTTKFVYFFMYIPKCIWAVGVIVEAWKGTVSSLQIAGLIGMLSWALHTLPAWRNGLPNFARSDLTPLGPPEFATASAAPADGAEVDIPLDIGARPPLARMRFVTTDFG